MMGADIGDICDLYRPESSAAISKADNQYSQLMGILSRAMNAAHFADHAWDDISDALPELDSLIGKRLAQHGDLSAAVGFVIGLRTAGMPEEKVRPMARRLRVAGHAVF